MSSMPWVKIYTEMLDDPKIGRLTATLRWRFIELILLAGECDAEGYLMKGEEPLTIDDIAWRLRSDPENLKENMERLQEAGLIDNHDGAWLICKFSDRQGRSQSEKRRQWREAQKRKRENDVTPTEENDITNEIPNNHNDVIDESSMSHTPREEERREEENLAAGAASPPIQEKKKPLKYPERDAIIKHFLIKTNLPAPKTDNAHIKETQKRWWTPAADILGWVDNDVGRATALIDRAIKSMKNGKDNLTISSFQSIMSNAADEYAKSGQAPSDIYTKLAEQGYVVRKAN